MDLRQSLFQPRVLTAWGLCLAAAVVGMVVGYGFGVRVGGTQWLGVVAALCAGGFCSLMADAGVSRLMLKR